MGMKLPPDLERKVLEASKVGPPAIYPPASEDEFQQQVIALARSHGWKVAHFGAARVLCDVCHGAGHCSVCKGEGYVWRTPAQADGEGFPDLIMVRGEAILVVELKFGKNKPTKKQKEWLTAFGWTSAVVVVWYPHDMPAVRALLGAAA